MAGDPARGSTDADGRVSADALTRTPAAVTGFGRAAPWLLMGAYTICFVDRQIINILAEYIRRDLHLNDVQIGMMTGLSFALFYTGLGIPLARLSERYNRKRIIAAALVVWSGFTIACGTATHFLQLFLLRVGVGVGEAGCTPAAQSMIVDYTPSEKRSSTMALYMTGSPLGAFIGMAMGGLVASHWGWRVAFLVAGLPGLFMAIIILAVLSDPHRERRENPDAANHPTFGQAIRDMWRSGVYRYLALGAGLLAFMINGQGAFLASFYLRVHGEELIAASGKAGPGGLLGMILGLAIGVGQIAGILVGGMLADRAAIADRRRCITIAAVPAAASIPCFIAAMLVHGLIVSLALYALSAFLVQIWLGPVFAAVPSVVDPRSRATAVAVTLFMTSLFGLGLGPLCIGAISDRLATSSSSGEALRWALISVTLVGMIAVPVLLRARKHIRQEWRD